MKQNLIKMELLRNFFMVALLFACIQFSASAQKIINLDEDLSANSEMMPVKLKAGTGMFKYSFGEFAVISTKNKDNNVNNIESRDTLAYLKDFNLSKYKEEVWGKTEQHQNFVFLGNQTDSVLANMTSIFNYNSSQFSENRPDMQEETTVIKNSNERFIAFLTPVQNMPSWVVEMDTQLGREVNAPGGIICNGRMTDGASTIQIESVRTWSTGKSSKLFPILGFTFTQEGKCLAAVQASRNAGSKKYVWIRNDLGKELRLMLASAATTVMAMVDQQVSR